MPEAQRSLTDPGSPGAFSGASPRWTRSYAWIRRIEGGWLNHPEDPGGATYAGVSLRAVVRLDANADGILDFDLDGDGDVDADDIRALWRADVAGDPAAAARIEQFYLDGYWFASRASELPWPLCLYHFDAAVHHGPAAAGLLLQRAAGAKQDGIVGPRTVALARSAAPYRVRQALTERLVLLHRILAKRGVTFARGWFSRVVELEAEGLREVA